MIHLITGGSGSGKSRYAEQQILELGEGRRIYLATMKAIRELTGTALCGRRRILRLWNATRGWRS